MSETKTLYLDLVPTAQDSLTAAVDRLDSIGLAGAGAVRQVVEPYLSAVRSTARYLSVDHGQVLEATLGLASKLVDQQRAYLVELGDVLTGKAAAPRSGRARSTGAAA
jgi:hypothetical protein